TPRMPPGNSRSSLAMVPGSPSTRAMPSPATVPAPTSSRVTFGLNDSTCFFSASAISSGSIGSSLATWFSPLLGSRSQLLECLLEPAPDGSIDDLVAHPGPHAADHLRVHHHFQVDPFSRESGQRAGQLFLPLVVELDGGASLDHHAVPPGRGPFGQSLDAPHRIA